MLRVLPRHVAPYARWSIRRYASITSLDDLPKVGDRLHGFTVSGTKHVPELELSAILCHHDKTGAQYLHIARDDNNNAFSIGFKTNPPDATGVPHILEHVTLCSSEKYPVRDPFFKMLPRSLNNFMNAYTSADWTMYPIATTNKTDYRNLMTMYLDATLHPLLKKFDFLQEGWRVGPENPQAAAGTPGGDLVFKGVVYNEMKGQFSDASYLYYTRWLQQVYPSLNFYGGDPQKITDLTWEQLRNFHAEHYHPSNSKIMTYGDTPLHSHLEIIGPELDRFDKINVDTDIKMPDQLAQPQRIVVQGPHDPSLPEDAQNKVSLTWLTGATKHIHESFALRVGTTLLLDGYGSAAYKALIESGLGTDYTVNTGYDTSAAQGMFSIGINGVSDANLEKIEEKIKQCISEEIEHGYDQLKIDGLLHQLDLGLKHKTPGFGMSILNRLTPSWFNGTDPLEALEWNSIVERFRKSCESGDPRADAMKKYFITDNYLSFTMRPSCTYASALAKDEKRRLQSKIAAVVEQTGSQDAADAQLREQELQLLEEQENGRKQSVNCLPTLRVSDIPRQQPKIELTTGELSPKMRIQWRTANTNGLTYFRAIAPFTIEDELRPLLPLFFGALARIGTRNKSMQQLETEIKLKTSGINFSYHSTPLPTDFNQVEEGLLISSYALDQNVNDMYALIRTLLLETDFKSDEARHMIKQLLQASASGAIDGIAESGHGYARRFAESGLTRHAYMSEQIAGITQVEKISALASLDVAAPDMDALLEKLTGLQSRLAGHLASNARTALTCGAQSASENEKSLSRFLSSLSLQAATSPQGLQLATQIGRKTFVDLPFQVYYSGLALSTYSYSDDRGAPLAVLAQLITHKHLHHEIREKGGAYGAGAYSRALDGLWGMYSYRDSNPENTMTVMYDAGKWAAEQSFTDEEMEEAKLSLFQGIDAPQSVSKEGMLRFVSGIDHDMQQHRRELILDVSKSQIKDAAKFIAGQLGRTEKLVILGEKKAFVDGSWSVRDFKRS